ncbi:hybrid sensor histidine kinase/response regulator [Salinisphaera hydrothermalis]|uniref:hybrid sensor histidine kinase/response regulator n=1 Tax=Salinisphaera hydrothermalis TaxID=563188 RepID=UPI003342925A
MTTSANGEIVLFVDDEPMIRKYFERAFSRDMRIMTADGSQAAYAVLETYGEDVAILMTDQRMPAGDGVSLLHAVKTEYPHIVRLLTTAYSELEHAVAAVNQGEIWRYITKPWDLESLRETLSDALEVYRYRKYEQALLAERRQATLTVASYMAHEMRTPLRSIHAGARGLEKHLSTLFDGYDWAIRHGADIEPLTQRHRAILGESTANMQRVANRANAVIELLLANAGAFRISPDSFELCAITDCVEAALEDFPFNDLERSIVQWDKGDHFSFNGSMHLMILVLHNLLRNALRAVIAKGNGTIRIWADARDDINFLHVKDTGTGIPARLLPRIFDDFASFSGDQHGAGIGLSFCHKVMASFGGDIRCSSVECEYTQFDLQFPSRQNE